MNSFDFYSPTYFVFGRDRENEAGRYVKKFGGSRVMIVYGGQSAKKSGLLDRVKDSITAEGLSAIELGGVKPNPRSGLIYDGIAMARQEKVDFLLAIGGGSVIDTAKTIAMGVPYDGDFWDFFSGKTPETALPVGVVLTIAASGSEGSPNAIVTNPTASARSSPSWTRSSPRACPPSRPPAVSPISSPTLLSATSPPPRTWRPPTACWKASCWP